MRILTKELYHNIDLHLITGQKFAMFEMKITLSRIIRQFKLSLTHNPEDRIRPKASIVLISANGIRIKVESRNKHPVMENGLTGVGV